MPRTRRDAEFWEIVEGLNWRLADTSGSYLPQEGEFFEGRGGRVWPRWATHSVAFLLGCLTCWTLLAAPPMVSLVALAVFVSGLTFVAHKRLQ